MAPPGPLGNPIETGMHLAFFNVEAWTAERANEDEHHWATKPRMAPNALTDSNFLKAC